MKGTAKILGAIVATAILGIAGAVVSPQISRAQKVIVKELLSGSIVLKVPVQLKLVMPGVGYAVDCTLFKGTLGEWTGNKVIYKSLYFPEIGAGAGNISSGGSLNKTVLLVFNPGDVILGKPLSAATWYICALLLTNNAGQGYANTVLTGPALKAWRAAKPGTEYRGSVTGYLPGKGPGGAVKGITKKSLGAASKN
ncbi:hypothetical protein MnTg02_00680 [bacterium MnTg02]|nr:hypothetical protein MnTg02_00680 [bacterium MnTg02]